MTAHSNSYCRGRNLTRTLSLGLLLATSPLWATHHETVTLTCAGIPPVGTKVAEWDLLNASATLSPAPPTPTGMARSIYCDDELLNSEVVETATDTGTAGFIDPAGAWSCQAPAKFRVQFEYGNQSAECAWKLVPETDGGTR